MIGTFLPLVFLPEYAFRIGVAPTFEGQYILKNLVFVAAEWTVLLPHCLPTRSTGATEMIEPTVAKVRSRRVATNTVTVS